MNTRVLFVNMPFSGVDRPQIGISLLKSALRVRGIPCEIQYFNHTLAEWVGPTRYQWYSGEIDHTIFAGEWVFAHYFFGDALVDGEGYFRHIREKLRVTDSTIQAISEMRRLVEPFLRHCLDSIDWTPYTIIGFTSTFEQNVASLALAHALKERYPEKIIVMGGANCEDPMGQALHRCFPFLDYVFSGEADNSFPEFVERIANNQPVHDVPGLVYRDGRESRFTGNAAPIIDMDSLPFPDYDDFFDQREHSPSLKSLIPPLLQIETARGCWWGAKHHCTFCGLNALTMSFRAKSKARALDEILHLASRYPSNQLSAVDNILDLHYFKDLLPELKRRKLSLKLFYEVKANLSKDQVRLLADAGVEMIQPGIESMHAHMLTLMRKGVTPLQNVQLLKWCAEMGVRPYWNLLYGFPGESARDYEEMLPLLQSLTHLQPPDGYGTIRLDRFSPYFRDPVSFGMANARPMKTYRYIYPFPEKDLADIAYFYEYTFANGLDPDSYIGPTLQLIGTWKEAANKRSSLIARKLSTSLLEISDTRPTAKQRLTLLQGWQMDLYDFCDQVRSITTIDRWLRENVPEVSASEAHEFLDQLVQLRLMARDGDRYLSLAVAVRADDRWSSFPYQVAQGSGTTAVATA